MVLESKNFLHSPMHVTSWRNKGKNVWSSYQYPRKPSDGVHLSSKNNHNLWRDTIDKYVEYWIKMFPYLKIEIYVGIYLVDSLPPRISSRWTYEDVLLRV